MKFTYPAEKFASARISLMLPHPLGEAQSIADAFAECALCFDNLRSDDLDDGAQAALIKLKELMDTTGLEDSTKRGLYKIKADLLSLEQRYELSRVIDELASWFEAQFEIFGP